VAGAFPAHPADIPAVAGAVPAHPAGTPGSPPAVSFAAVSFAYQQGSTASVLGLRGVSLDIPRNSSVALIGRSGCGKTTLLKHINALLLPAAGAVCVLGQNTLDKAVKLRALRFKAGLAIQSPESALFETYIADDVSFGPRNAGERGRALFKKVSDALEAVALPFAAFADRETVSLSGGEKRRAALAGVLALDSEMLLLDEPAAGLDGKNQARIANLIRELQARGKTVIVTTHSMEAAAAFDYVGVMDKGRLAAFGTPRAIFGRLWRADWGLRLPWTVAVARALTGGSDSAVPLSAAELLAFVQSAPPTPPPVPVPVAGEDAGVLPNAPTPPPVPVPAAVEDAGVLPDAPTPPPVPVPAAGEDAGVLPDAPTPPPVPVPAAGEDAGVLPNAPTPPPVPAAEPVTVPPQRRRKTGTALFRNNPFGQFLDRPSALRRLGAGKKLLLLFVLGSAAVAGRPLFSAGIAAFIIAAGFFFGKIKPALFLKGIVPALPFAGVFIFFQLIFAWSNDTSRVFLRLGIFSITGDEIRRSLSIAARVIALISAFSLYLAVTPLRETLRAVNALLFPLARFGIPGRDIAMIIGISLRFVPVLTEETERIVTAQVSRGGKRGIKAALSLIIPLLLRALERSETLAQAMLLRLYRSSGASTR
jgi:energy-coupling factor transport system ATP-binding protein